MVLAVDGASEKAANVNPYYPHMLSPIRVGRHTLRNRIIMGSMHTRLEHADQPIAREAAFYSARARGGAALVVTGGFSPNEDGRMEEGGPIFNAASMIEHHRPIVEAVKREGAKMLLQILHAGAYAKHDRIVGVSGVRSPINPRTPRVMTSTEIEQTIADHIRCAELAQEAGYDGVEIMGSEGYLITQFTAPRTNKRTDEWGGSLENRCRFPLAIVRAVRERLGANFLLMYRISAIDLVEEGSTGEEIDYLAREIQAAGADILSTGVGWHEFRVPTIAYVVPRGAWSFAVARLKKAVSIPVVASNRINMPETAEGIIAAGVADLVSMARPMLADPDFVKKAEEGRTSEINTCIACNQACLDFIFSDRIATCLVNPQACRELDFRKVPAAPSKRLAVVGSGPAGIAFASTAASRGHNVTLYESGSEMGGQLQLARRIPKKDEFNEMLRYLERRIEIDGVEIRKQTVVEPGMLSKEGYDHIVIAAGVQPRTIEIDGIDHPSVLSYFDVVSGRAEVGKRVAIIGMGGIGYDVAELLGHGGNDDKSVESFFDEWGVDTAIGTGGGLRQPVVKQPARQITMFQRRDTKPGDRLGVSTGWILKARLKRWKVDMVTGATYRRIDDRGLHYSVGTTEKVLAVDNIIICAGQEPNDELARSLQHLNIPISVIGGAHIAAELDALRAIDEGTRLAYAI